MRKNVFIQSPMFDYFVESVNQGYNAFFDKREAEAINLTPIFQKDLLYRIKRPAKGEARPQRNLALQIFSTATSGTGKSRIALSIMERMLGINKIPFEAKKYVHFSTVELNKAINKYSDEKGAVFLLDETRNSERFGIGSTAYLTRINDIVNVSREAGLSLIRISQDYKRTGLAIHYVLDAYKINYYTNQNMALVMDREKRYFGHVVLNSLQDKNVLSDYEELKTNFIDKVKKGLEAGSRSEVQSHYAQELLDNELYHKAKNKAQKYVIAQQVLGSEIPQKLMELIIAEADLKQQLIEESEEFRDEKK